MAVSTIADTRVALRQVTAILGLAILPLVMLAVLIGGAFSAGTLGMDFFGGVLHGTHAMLDGHAPYRPDRIQHLLDVVRLHGTPTRVEEVAYPPAALVAATPLALLPHGVAAVLWTAFLCTLPGLAIAALGVRDWRCYGATYLSLPVSHSIILGNPNLVVMLCLALCWRWRDRVWPAACALAVMLSLKLTGLPLLVWLVATRRTRSAIGAASLALVATVAGFAIVGFGEISPYITVVSGLSRAQEASSYSLSAVASGLGIAGASHLLIGIVVAGLLLAVWAARSSPQAASRAFALATLALLVEEPFVHQLYFALLLVPIAIATPHFGWRWLLLIPCWVFPYESIAGRPLGFVLVAVIVAGYLLATVVPEGSLRQIVPFRRLAAEPG
ncbi:MAG TPA: glycosyltransferase family 87 protein [Gaiellales bacterium]